MFIPLYDSNRLRFIRIQYVTIGLIALNVVVYFGTVFAGENFTNAAMLGLGFIPSVVHHTAELAPQYIVVPETLSYVTYSFLHADLIHLGGNMLFLWVFGDNVEDALGHLRYLVFYLACAVGGALLHGMVAPDSQAPLIGASGAIAGVVTAYLILYPRVKVWILAFARIPLRIPAYVVLALWIGTQFVLFLRGGEDEVSWACHVGGILTGAVLVFVLRRRDVLSDLAAAPAAVPESEAAEPLPPHPRGPWDGR
ncbi:rhomboid family intramembrane serine protease [Mesorhizobium sp. SP-1A]|uniref:rhomboid family intramembrane serine protease n=1 Tax=Mesorhizobium sp. SP-1A TaxID=3077840 RepID=UPI0028F6FC3B|nr:rhomboid family intramembrane serine protease [Mesorhizobium sp. SP-1A]